MYIEKKIPFAFSIILKDLVPFFQMRDCKKTMARSHRKIELSPSICSKHPRKLTYYLQVRLVATQTTISSK